MYFWNIEKLNKDLKKGLSPKEDLKYLTIYIIGGFLSVTLPIENFYDKVSFILEIILTIFSIYLFYKVNGGNKGEKFLSRYFSIGFVAFVRSLVFILLPLMIIYGISLGVLYGVDIPEQSTILDVIFLVIYFIFYIYLTIKYLKKLLKN